MTRLKVFSILLFIVFGLAAYFVTPDRTGAKAKGFVGEVPAAPTGLNASDNWYINKVGLRWDAIRGATLYRIFRNPVNNPSTATDVGTTDWLSSEPRTGMSTSFVIGSRNSLLARPSQNIPSGEYAAFKYDGDLRPVTCSRNPNIALSE